MEEALRKELQAQLRSLLPVLLAESGRPFLNLFDEFVENHEFELAVHVVCDFMLEPNSPPVSTSTVEQIRRLHVAMEIDNHCVENPQSQKSR
jgi:hypothetical protein